jgi:hypothetical protein
MIKKKDLIQLVIGMIENFCKNSKEFLNYFYYLNNGYLKSLWSLFDLCNDNHFLLNRILKIIDSIIDNAEGSDLEIPEKFDKFIGRIIQKYVFKTKKKQIISGKFKLIKFYNKGN